MKKSKPVSAPSPIPSKLERTHLLSGSRASVVRLAIQRREEVKAQLEARFAQAVSDCDEEIRRVLDEASPDAPTIGPFAWDAKGEGPDRVTITTKQDVTEAGK